MPEDRLAEYRRRRDASRTPEPVPDGPLPRGDGDTFVIQEHHARSLHWDLRLERDGVLVSWAVPRGLPPEPGVNRLAVHTEDHPLEYASFAGTIPKGEYGGGSMTIWDRGTYQTRTWSGDKVTVVLSGTRVRGTYHLFATRDRNWMIRRLDPPTDPDWQPLPDQMVPMEPVQQANLPRPAGRYTYEFDWGGIRAIGYVLGGRLRLTDRTGSELVTRYRKLSGGAEPLGARQAVLDGEIVRLGGADVYLVYDLLHLDGCALLAEPQQYRQELLDELPLTAETCQRAPRFDDGPSVLAIARQRGLPGVVARRRDARYQPGRRSSAWKRVPA